MKQIEINVSNLQCKEPHFPQYVVEPACICGTCNAPGIGLGSKDTKQIRCDPFLPVASYLVGKRINNIYLKMIKTEL